MRCCNQQLQQHSPIGRNSTEGKADSASPGPLRQSCIGISVSDRLCLMLSRSFQKGTATACAVTTRQDDVRCTCSTSHACSVVLILNMQPSWYTSIFCSHACTVVLILSMHCCPCPQHAARMEHQQILQDLTAHAAACPHGSGKACTAQHTMCVDDQAS